MSRPSTPVLETELLSMCPLTVGDLPELIALYSDPRVTRFLQPLDEAAHLRRLEDAEASWASRRFGRVGLYERESGRFVGRGGLHYWPQFDEVEVGWVLRADVWGRGYATDAGRAWIHWGFEHVDVPYITAYIDPDNEASRSVAHHLGMSPLRTDVFHDNEVIVYATARPGTALER